MQNMPWLYTVEQGKNRNRGMHVIFDFFSNF